MELYKIKLKILKNEKIIEDITTSFTLNDISFKYSQYSTGAILEYKKEDIKNS